MNDSTPSVHDICEDNYYRRSALLGSILARALRLRKGAATRAAITDLPIALDLAFEQAADETESLRLVHILDAVAEGRLGVESMELQHERAVVRMAARLVCGVRDAGMQLPEGVRDAWTNLWLRHLHLHDVQQYAQCRWRFDGHRTAATATSIEASIDQYLREYSHTNSLILITVASFPQSKIKTIGWLQAQHALACLFEPSMRLAQDLIFQPDEPMNLPLYVHSARTSTPVDVARFELQQDNVERQFIEDQLRKHFPTRLRRAITQGGRLVFGPGSRGHRLELISLFAVETALTASLSAYVYAR